MLGFSSSSRRIIARSSVTHCARITRCSRAPKKPLPSGAPGSGDLPVDIVRCEEGGGEQRGEVVVRPTRFVRSVHVARSTHVEPHSRAHRLPHPLHGQKARLEQRGEVSYAPGGVREERGEVMELWIG